jgi:DNA-binding response OmpR family regulator
VAEAAARYKKILAVDDEVHMLRLIEYSLTREGYTVLTAGNGKEAIEMANLERPDLILLDIRMPRMNGYEVFASLREQPKTTSIPVIFISILSDEEETIKLGAQRIQKPFSPSVLINKIRSVLEEFDVSEKGR